MKTTLNVVLDILLAAQMIAKINSRIYLFTYLFLFVTAYCLSVIVLSPFALSFFIRSGWVNWVYVSQIKQK